MIRRGASADERVALNATRGSRLISDGTDPNWFNIEAGFYAESDFIIPTVSADVANLMAIVNAGGAALALADSAHPGTIDCSTSTSATGMRGWASPEIVVFSGGEWEVNWYLQIPTLSTGSEEFLVRAGWTDQSTADATDGVFIEYDRAVNGVNWFIVTANNSTRTRSDSGVVVNAGTWYKLRIRVNAAGNSASFFINGTETSNSPITSNIPVTTARATSFNAHIRKTVGTTARDMYLDYFSAYCKLTASR